MIFGSLCSGIEAASVAWAPLGWRAAFFSEIAKFPSAVLAHHYPDIPNHGDMREFNAWPLTNIDVLCGGTPCQSFSVAGLREGIRDPRGALTRTFLEVAARYRPRWVLWENVPGVRSSDDGRALGAFLAGLGELGYGYAWASLDAQYFGLAQRRERVFVVASARGWQCAAAVLFDAACMRGDPAPSRETREGVAGTLSARTSAGGGLGTDFDLSGGIVARPSLPAGPLISMASGQAGAEIGIDCGPTLTCLHEAPIVAGTLLAQKNATGGDRPPGTTVDTTDHLVVTHALTASGFDASEDGTGRGTPLVPVTYDLQQITSKDCRANPQPGDPAGSLCNPSRVVTVNARQDPDVDVDVDVVGPLDTDGSSFAIQAGALRENPSSGPDGVGVQRGVAYTIEARAEVQAVAHRFGVRRLTPRECERLQGFPDDYTLIPYRGKPAADGPRYAALGNSWAVPCVRWIGARIQLVDELLAERDVRAA